MLFGYYFNSEGKYHEVHHMDESNPEAVWQYVFNHQHDPRVIVTDANDNIVIEMLEGKIAWPDLDPVQKDALYKRFTGRRLGGLAS